MKNELRHHSVLGMKWGVRKDKVKTTRTYGNYKVKNKLIGGYYYD